MTTKEDGQHQANSDFDAAFREKLTHLMQVRRDVRRFRRTPIPEDILDRLLHSVDLAPSVGLSEPWRIVHVQSPTLRNEILEEFRLTNIVASQEYQEEKLYLYRSLKLAGLEEAPVHLAIYCDTETNKGSGLGKQTMPESLEYSVVAAIQNLWLMARAFCIGVGWVSILRPERINEILDVGTSWKLIAYLCVGYPEEDVQMVPDLEIQGWETRSIPENERQSRGSRRLFSVGRSLKDQSEGTSDSKLA